MGERYGKKLTKNNSYWSARAGSIGTCWRHYEKQGGNLDQELLFYAYVLLTTRRFEDVEVPPLLDMANAEVADKLNILGDFSGDPDDSTREKTAFCYHASKDIPKGTELLADYGLSDSSAMASFSLYGFALDPSEHNASAHDLDLEEVDGAVDGCSNLYRADWTDIPDKDTSPIWWNYYIFAVKHCFEKPTKVVSWRHFFGTYKGKKIAAGNCFIGLGAGLVYWTLRQLRENDEEQKEKAKEAEGKKKDPEVEDRGGETTKEDKQSRKGRVIKIEPRHFVRTLGLMVDEKK